VFPNRISVPPWRIGTPPPPHCVAIVWPGLVGFSVWVLLQKDMAQPSAWVLLVRDLLTYEVSSNSIINTARPFVFALPSSKKYV
jgi:hypothetical protein